MAISYQPHASESVHQIEISTVAPTDVSDQLASLSTGLKGVDRGSLEANFRPEFWEVFDRSQREDTCLGGQLIRRNSN